MPKQKQPSSSATATTTTPPTTSTKSIESTTTTLILQKKLHKYKRKIINLEDSISELKQETIAQLESRDEEIAVLNQQIETLESNKFDHIAELKDDNEVIKQLTEKFREEKRNDVESYKRLYDRFVKGTEVLEAEIERLQSEHLDQINNVKSAWKEMLQREKTEHQETKTKLEQCQKNKGDPPLLIIGELQKKEEEVESLKRDLEFFRGQIGILNAELERLQQYADRCSMYYHPNNQIQFQTQVEFQAHQIQDLHIHLNNLHADLQSKHDELQIKQRQIVDYSHKFVDLQNENEELSKQISTLKLERTIDPSNQSYQPGISHLQIAVDPHLSYELLLQHSQSLEFQIQGLKILESNLCYDLETSKSQYHDLQNQHYQLQTQQNDHLNGQLKLHEENNIKVMESLKRQHEEELQSLQVELQDTTGKLRVLEAHVKLTTGDDGDLEDPSLSAHSIVIQLKTEIAILKEQLQKQGRDSVDIVRKIRANHEEQLKELKVKYFDLIMQKIDENPSQSVIVEGLLACNDGKRQKEVSVLDKLVSLSEAEKKVSPVDQKN